MGGLPFQCGTGLVVGRPSESGHEGGTPASARRRRVRAAGAATPPFRSHVFTQAERAALELTERALDWQINPCGVSDNAWANAVKHYDEDQLTALESLIAVINTNNRLNVITREPAGDYQPGLWG
jgi:alkylhydroperoxidase family enzyme